MKKRDGTGWRTTYDGPVMTVEVTVGGVTVTLARPSEPDRLLDDPDVVALNRVDDYMPYWAYLWPGALLLAESVAREVWAPGARALEIGCGLGLAGLVGLKRGLSVKFTDYDPAALDFVTRSALGNGVDGSRFSTATLDWREPPDERYEVILGADLLYEARLVPLVANVLERMLGPGGIALIADPNRITAERFPDLVRRRELSCEALRISAEGGEFGPIRGTLYRVTKGVSIAGVTENGAG